PVVSSVTYAQMPSVPPDMLWRVPMGRDASPSEEDEASDREWRQLHHTPIPRPPPGGNHVLPPPAAAGPPHPPQRTKRKDARQNSENTRDAGSPQSKFHDPSLRDVPQLSLLRRLSVMSLALRVHSGRTSPGHTFQQIDAGHSGGTGPARDRRKVVYRQRQLAD